MTKPSQGRPWGFALAALLVFALASVLPIWTAWRFTAREGLGELGPFWAMLASIPGTAGEVGTDVLLTLYAPEAIKLLAVLGVAFWLGWLVGRRRRTAPS